MGLLDRLLGRRDEVAVDLYAAIVARARRPQWYVDGRVPDTVDGRFDMVAAVLSIVLLRLERDPAAAAFSARLTERFVEDMDGQLREIGIGDIVVGKHIGKMMAMLGGRLGAYRDGLANDALEPALARNLYRGDPPDGAFMEYVARGLRALAAALDTTPLARIKAGTLP